MARRDYTYGSAGDCTITFDLLPPEGRIVAPTGSMHLDLAAYAIYLKVEGTESIGWVLAASGGGGLPDGDYGDVTISGDGTLITINDAAITLDKLQDIPSGYLLGRTSPDSGDVELIAIDSLVTPPPTAAEVSYDNDTSGLVADDVQEALDEIVRSTGPSASGFYRFDTVTAAADPGSGQMRYNHATPALVTALYVDQLSQPGTDVDRLFGMLVPGMVLLVQQKTDATRYLQGIISAAPTNNTGWWTIPITVSASGALPAAGTSCNFVLMGGGTVAGGADTQVLFNDGGVQSGDSGFTFDKTNKAVDIGGATVTTSQPALEVAQTWNAGAVVFKGIVANFSLTGTSAAALSSCLDLQANGTSIFSVGPFITGGSLFLRPVIKLPQFSYVINSAGGWVAFGASNTALTAVIHGGQIRIAGDGVFGFVSSTTDAANNAYDVGLLRDAAGQLAQRVGTNAQIFRVYNTYTNSSNYERAKLGWSSNVLQIGTEKLGTGIARALDIQTDGTTRGTWGASGGLAMASANTLRLGDYTVATLPAAGTVGRTAYVTDGTASLADGATVTGGGSTKYMVWDDGSNWKIFGGGASSSGSGGGFTLAGETVLGSAGTTLTVTGLDLATDRIYYFELITDNQSGANIAYAAVVNNDTTATNYDTGRLGMNGASSGSAGANNGVLCSGITNGLPTTIHGWIRQNFDGKPTIMCQDVETETTSRITGWTAITHRTAANLTRFDVVATANMPIGSRLSVYKALAATPPKYGTSIATQGPGFDTDTLVTGSAIAVPTTMLKAGTRYRLRIAVGKTAAGTATPIVNVRFGTNGTTADTALCTHTFPNGTATADGGTFDLDVVFRSVGSGSAAVLESICQIVHDNTAVGLINVVSRTNRVASAGFDSTVANSIISVSLNGGTSAAWTVYQANATLENLL